MCGYWCWKEEYLFSRYRRAGALVEWNQSGFRPPLCTYRLNWARRTSWGWWDDCDDTVLQTQDSKFEPSRSRRLPTILPFTRGWGRNIFCFFQTTETGNRTPNSGVKGSGANHYPTPRALVHWLKLAAWKVGDRGFEPHSGLQVSKKQNGSYPLTRND